MQIKNSAVSMIIDATDQKELEEIKLQFLGRNGKLTLAMKEMAKLPKEKRPEIGMLANDVKKIIEETIKNHELRIMNQESETRAAKIDVTNPTNPGKLTVSGPDKQMVGQFSAVIRGMKPPEPYKGMGVKYENEVIRRKAGKAFTSGSA